MSDTDLSGNSRPDTPHGIDISGNPVSGMPNGGLKPYYGRGIVLGRTDKGHPYAAYFVTGRSPPSRARILMQEGDDIEGRIFTRPTDDDTLSKGNPELLLYDAMRWHPGMIVVSNGRQTADIENAMSNPAPFVLHSGEGRWSSFYRSSPKFVQRGMEMLWALNWSQYTPNLTQSATHWDPEPDAPNFTPRINGRILFDQGVRMQLGIIRRDDEKTEREHFWLDITHGAGRSITTYSGNAPSGEPLPPYRGEPRGFFLRGETASEIADAIEPHMGNLDFRVGLAVVLYRHLAARTFDIAVRNYAR